MKKTWGTDAYQSTLLLEKLKNGTNSTCLFSELFLSQIGNPESCWKMVTAQQKILFKIVFNKLVVNTM